jgi:hypothetical protein
MKLNGTTVSVREGGQEFMSTKYIFFVLAVLTFLMLFAAQLLLRTSF